ncbi:MAG: nucleotidyltransferase [bacterium]|nr:nucleotidyltransferase [bacterium]
MRVEKDYEELLRLLNNHEVRYCIVGSYAVAFHARPRYTKDIDILVEPNLENGKRIINALNEFGFQSLGLNENDFSEEKKIIQLGYEPVRVDFMTSIEGCTFEEVWKRRKEGIYGEERVFFIGIDELIKNKKSLNRKQDQADLEILAEK